MPFEIFDSSDALKSAKEDNLGINEKLYPFEMLSVGKSFSVPFDERVLRSLRTICWRKSKGDIKYKVVSHKEHGVIEVGRVA